MNAVYTPTGTLRATAKICLRCGKIFPLQGVELFYPTEPKYCQTCRLKRRNERGRRV